MRYLNPVIVLFVCVCSAAAEEMDLPHLANRWDLEFSNQADNGLERALLTSNSEIPATSDGTTYSERSLHRFLQKKPVDLAQLGNDFPTDYVQEPELDWPVSKRVDQAARAEEVATQQAGDTSAPPQPADLDNVPHPPSSKELQQLFSDRSNVDAIDAQPTPSRMQPVPVAADKNSIVGMSLGCAQLGSSNSACFVRELHALTNPASVVGPPTSALTCGALSNNFFAKTLLSSVLPASAFNICRQLMQLMRLPVN